MIYRRLILTSLNGPDQLDLDSVEDLIGADHFWCDRAEPIISDRVGRSLSRKFGLE